MTSPDPSAVSLPRLRVYTLAIYGGEDGKPLIAARIAEAMEISEPTVSDHLRKLTLDGYVKPYPKMKNPKLYARGKYADLLDERLRGPPNSASGGGPKVQNCTSGDKKPLPVPVGESHCDGRFIFPVLWIGDLAPLKIKDDRGVRRVEIFEREPVKWDNGVTIYNGKVPMDDGTVVKVAYWDTHDPALHVWPLPVPTVAGTVRTAKDRLQEAAERVTAILSKWGGWRFGPPEYVSNEPDRPGIHHATNDPLITQHLPPGFQPAAGSGYWVDGTPPPKSLETDEEALAEGMLGCFAAVPELRAGQRDLSAGQKSLDLRISELRHQLEGLVACSEMVAVSIANITAAEAEQIERAARELGNNIEAEVLGR